jgi:hypothetical protein
MSNELSASIAANEFIQSNSMSSLTGSGATTQILKVLEHLY